MKIGIITDIHSNINALNVVLNKFEEIERLKFPFYKGILKIFYGKE